MNMDKRMQWILRAVSFFCILMAIGAYQTSVISCVLMLLVGIGCLPGMQLILSRHFSGKFRIIVLVVLTVLALTISRAELEAQVAAGAEEQTTVSDTAQDA